MYRVFLSHGGGDTFVARELFAPRMREAGAKVFLDAVELDGGSNFRTEIFDELSRSDELVVLITKTSILRPWIFAEIGVAILRGIRIVPFVYGPRDTELSRLGIMSLLGTIKMLKYDSQDLADYISKLADRTSEASQ
jgi:hypothetical protein